MAGRCSAKTRAGHKTSVKDGKVHPWADSRGFYFGDRRHTVLERNEPEQPPRQPSPRLAAGVALPARSSPSKGRNDNDFSFLNYFEIQRFLKSRYLPVPAHSLARRCLPGTRLFIRAVTWGQPAQGEGPGELLSA